MTGRGRKKEEGREGQEGVGEREKVWELRGGKWVG